MELAIESKIVEAAKKMMAAKRAFHAAEEGGEKWETTQSLWAAYEAAERAYFAALPTSPGDEVLEESRRAIRRVVPRAQRRRGA